MKYFITNVSDCILQRTGIEFTKRKIKREPGIIIDHDNLLSLLFLEDMEIVSERETCYDGIVKVEIGHLLGIDLTKYEVKFGRAPSNYPDDFRKSVEDILIPIIRKDVVINSFDDSASRNFTRRDD